MPDDIPTTPDDRLGYIYELERCNGWTKFMKPFIQRKIEAVETRLLSGGSSENYQSDVLLRKELMEILANPETEKVTIKRGRNQSPGIL